MASRKFTSSPSRVLLGLVLCCSAMGITPVQAQQVGIEAVPTAWRMQSYVGGPMAIYFTGSSCGSGELVLPASATDGSRDQLLAVVLTGKVARQPVGIYYHVSGGQCLIDTFYLREGG